MTERESRPDNVGAANQLAKAAADVTCPTGRCAVDEVCVCNWYLARGWHRGIPTRHPRPRTISTGLRASGFREGFSHGAADALRRVWAYVPPGQRSQVEELAAAYAAEVHR